MKIALCLSGETRNFQKNFLNLKQYIIDPYNVDIFIHTWSYRGDKNAPKYYFLNYDHNEYNKYLNEDNTTHATELLKTYKPKQCLIEYPDKNLFIDQLEHSQQNSKNWWFNGLMMYYSIFKSNELKIRYEENRKVKYDIVIRSRMDLYFEYLSFDNTFEDCIDNNTIYLPPNENIDRKFNSEMKVIYEQYGHKYMPNDQFAYGTSEAMNYYSSIYTKFIENIDYAPHHGEGALSYHLWEKNQTEHRIKINSNIKMKLDPW